MKHRTIWVALGVKPSKAQHTAEEAGCLAQWARGRRCLVEIGVAEGASALTLRRAMDPNGDLWLIDPFHLTCNRLFNTGLVAARRTVGRCRRGRVHFLCEWSSNVSKKWCSPIDFLFIDGDHRYESVLADWKGFAPWVEPGGVVLFHDAVQVPGHPVGPVQAVDRLFRSREEPGWRIVEETGTIVVVLREERKEPVPAPARRVGDARVVSVAIPTWRRASWLQRCITALSKQTRPPDEVIVVGRADDAEAQAVVQAAQHGGLPLRWGEVDRPGHIAPVRRGLEMATGDLVAFLDDDTEPLPGWLAALMEPFSDPRVACVGGRVATNGFTGRVHRDAGRIRWYGQHVGNVGALDAPDALEVDGVMECNWAWRRAVLSRLHFDPVLDFDDASMYGLDLCLQVRDLGCQVVYQPAARVVHHAAPRSSEIDRRDRPQRVFCFNRNYTYIALKHFSPPRRAMFLAWWWLVGEAGAYGLARAMEGFLCRRNGVGAEIRAAWAGKAEGWKKWRGGG